jgi:hypothetical protein
MVMGVGHDEVTAENGGSRMLISVSSGLHSQAWKKNINGGSHLIVDDGVTWEKRREWCGQRQCLEGMEGGQAQCLGIWIRFRGPVVKLAFTRGRLVEWNCVAPNVIQLPR